MTDTPDLSIVLPCYNESKNIPLIVERLKKYWDEYNFELLLVDNGSADNTDEVIKGLQKDYPQIKLVTVKNNIGYGNGIKTGLMACRGSWIAYSHADIQTPPEDIFKAYEIALKNNIDSSSFMVKGKRVNRRVEEQFMTNWLAKIVNISLGLNLEDINGQPKLFRRDFLESIKNAPLDFSYDVHVMHQATMKNMEIKTFPVDFGVRVHGESKWASSILSKYKTILGYLFNIMLISLKNIKSENNPTNQFLKFGLVGILGVSTNYSIFYGLYKFFSVHYVLASSAGYLIAGAVIFSINRRWTFNIDHGKVSHQYVRFYLLVTTTFLLNGVSIHILTDIVKLIPEISQIFTVCLTIMCNFLGSKYWVFK